MKDTSGMVLAEKHLAFIDNQLSNTRKLANLIKPNMPILLAYLDNREHSELDLQNIQALANKNHMQFVDTSRRFIGSKIDDYSIYLLDSHPNNQAQIMFSNTIFDFIQQQKLFLQSPAS